MTCQNVWSGRLHFLGAFTKLQKATVSLIMSFCPSARTNSSATESICMKFNIWVIFEICLENSSFIEIWQEKRVLYMKIYVHFWSYLAQFVLEGESSGRKLYRKSKHILCSVTCFRKSCLLWDLLLLLWRYNSGRVLAFSTVPFHLRRSWTCPVHFIILIFSGHSWHLPIGTSVYEIMWKNMVEPERPHMSKRSTHIACWIT
jgi:hypothetical protein